MSKLASPAVLVERHGEVLVATLNRPHRRNGINLDLSEKLLGFFETRRWDRETKVIVLRGSGEHFCVGADLIEAGGPDDRMAAGIDFGDWRVTEITRAMRNCPQPIVAAVRGAVAGGGFSFALAADVILAAESAFFCTAFINIGLSGSELGLGWRLQRTIGLSLARELIYCGDKLPVERAEFAGLVSRIVPDAELDAEGLALAQRMARPTLDQLRLTKRNLDLALQSPMLDVAVELEERAQMRCANKGNFDAALADFTAKHGK